MKKVFLLLYTAMILMTSCKDSANEPTADEVTEDSTEMEESFQIAATFPSYFQYISAQDSSFSISNFEGGLQETADSMLSYPLDKKQLEPFKPYLIYNSDSSMAIDLVSYNYVAEKKKGKIVLQEAGPDFEVSLIDFKNNKKLRLIFFGTSGIIADARWENDSTILLAGALQENNLIRPTIWRFHAGQKDHEVYTHAYLVRAGFDGYKQSWLQNKGLEPSSSPENVQH